MARTKKKQHAKEVAAGPSEMDEVIRLMRSCSKEEILSILEESRNSWAYKTMVAMENGEDLISPVSDEELLHESLKSWVFNFQPGSEAIKHISLYISSSEVDHAAHKKSTLARSSDCCFYSQITFSFKKDHIPAALRSTSTKLVKLTSDQPSVLEVNRSKTTTIYSTALDFNYRDAA